MIQFLIISNTTCKGFIVHHFCWMSFSVCRLFYCFLTGWIERTIILAIMNSLSRCLHDLAMRFIVGKVYIFGQGSTYSFIYSLFFIILLKCVAANAFGIWSLRNTGKSVTNWVTHMLHKMDWDSATCVTYSTDYYQRPTLPSWFTKLEQTPLNRSQQLPAPYKRLIDEIKQN